MFEDTAGASSKAALTIIKSGGFSAKAVEQLGEAFQRGLGEDASEGLDEFNRWLLTKQHALASLMDKIKGDSEAYEDHAQAIRDLNRYEELLAENKASLTQEFIEAIRAAKEETDVVIANADAVVKFTEANRIMAESVNPEEVQQAIADYAEFEDVANDASAALQNQSQELLEWSAKEALLHAAIEELDYQIPVLTDKIERLGQIADIESDMYAASIAIKELGVSVEFTDSSVEAMVGTYISYKNKLEEMTDKQKEFTRANKETSLEMMKIELAASGNRGGRLNRGQKQQMEELQRAQLENRIAQMEGDLELQDFKDNYYDQAEQDYNDWVAVQKHQIHELQDIRNDEIMAANHSLNQMIVDRDTYNADLLIVLDKEAKIQAQHYARMIALKAAYERAGVTVPKEIMDAINAPAPTATTSTATSQLSLKEQWEIQQGLRVPQLDIGIPYVPKTDIYKLQEGERVITRTENIQGGRRRGKIPITILIDVNAQIHNYADLEMTGDQIGRCVASGILTNVDSEFEVG